MRSGEEKQTENWGKEQSHWNKENGDGQRFFFLLLLMARGFGRWLACAPKSILPTVHQNGSGWNTLAGLHVISWLTCVCIVLLILISSLRSIVAASIHKENHSAQNYAVNTVVSCGRWNQRCVRFLRERDRDKSLLRLTLICILYLDSTWIFLSSIVFTYCISRYNLKM